MKRLCCRLVLGCFAVCPALSALALPPDQIFERVSPGIWVLRTLDPNNQPFNHGTAVAIAARKVVTSCSVLVRAFKVELLRDKDVLPATLEFPDTARDLCQLDVPGLQAAEPVRAAPRMGQRVYAIGYERGTDVSIADGLVTRAREAGTDAERIQTSAPNSGGLYGAGLYDEEARLLGIVTAPPGDASGVVFALPAKWIADLAERGRAVLASRTKAAAARPSTVLPAPGESWQYAYALRGVGGTRFSVSVRVVGVEGNTVQESVTIVGSAERRLTVAADNLSFRSIDLPRSLTLVELAPYLPAVLARGESPSWGKLSGYPLDGLPQVPWTITVHQSGTEEVKVPAGTFNAVRVQVAGQRSYPGHLPFSLNQRTGRFSYRIWYAPEVRRYVKLQHETWSLNGQWSGEELVELDRHEAK